MRDGEAGAPAELDLALEQALLARTLERCDVWLGLEDGGLGRPRPCRRGGAGAAPRPPRPPAAAGCRRARRRRPPRARRARPVSASVARRPRPGSSASAGRGQQRASTTSSAAAAARLRSRREGDGEEHRVEGEQRDRSDDDVAAVQAAAGHQLRVGGDSAPPGELGLPEARRRRRRPRAPTRAPPAAAHGARRAFPAWGHDPPSPTRRTRSSSTRRPATNSSAPEQDRHRARSPRARGRHLRRDPARPGEAQREVDLLRIAAAGIAPARAGEQPPELVHALGRGRVVPDRGEHAELVRGSGAPRLRSRRAGPRCSRARTTTRAREARLPRPAAATRRAPARAGPGPLPLHAGPSRGSRRALP